MVHALSGRGRTAVRPYQVRVGVGAHGLSPDVRLDPHVPGSTRPHVGPLGMGWTAPTRFSRRTFGTAVSLTPGHNLASLQGSNLTSGDRVCAPDFRHS